MDALGALSSVMGILSKGIIGLAAILVVFGLVQLGLALKDGISGGGGQISSALAMVAGGVIVGAAAALFTQVSFV